MNSFGSLFSGIGGMDLGLERAGFKCAWQVEIDPYCLRVLAKHWPDVKKYKDVRNVGKRNLKPVTLIAGGFPCQPHSVAGKREGAEDDRNLWPEFMRIIRETKPQYILGENVPGIVTSYLDKVLADLEGAGYSCETFNLPAVAFDAPHRRERIFIVAYANSIRKLQPEGLEQEKRGWPSDSGEDVSHTSIERQQMWAAESRVGRVAHGVPDRVDRLRGLGNAVVPQIAEWIGRRILEYNGSLRVVPGRAFI